MRTFLGAARAATPQVNVTSRVYARAALLLAATLLIGAPLRAQDAEVPRVRTFPGIESPSFPYARPEEAGLSSEKLDRLGDEMAEWVAAGELIGAELLIVKDRRTVFHEAYGWGDREGRRPMQRNSFFSIKSMSKPFTTMAILMLEEEGRLSLDDRVDEYIRTFTNDRTTIRHLLTHTSGYDGLGDTEEFRSLEEWVLAWAREEPNGSLGAYSYSDFNYAALGFIVEAVSGMPVEAFIEERIIAPLGLEETHTAFAPDAAWARRMNSRYRWNEEIGDYERYWSNQDRQSWPFYPAAWGLYATAMDYAKFMAVWLDRGRIGERRLLSEASVLEALQPQTGRTPFGYGYGWFVREAPSAEGMPWEFAHGGYDGTVAAAYPAGDAIVIYLTHSRGGGHQQAFWNRIGMLEIFEMRGPHSDNLVWADQSEVTAIDLAPEEWARYVGTYRADGPPPEGAPKVIVRIWQEGDRLHVRMGEPGQRADLHWHLVPVGQDLFAPGRYRAERLVAVDPVGRIRFIMEHDEAVAVEAVVDDRVQFSARRAQNQRR